MVVADQRSPRDGRVIESIGHYNPQTEPSTIVIDRERLDHWIERGAQPTNTVRKLMRAENTEAGRGAADEPEAAAPRAPTEPEAAAGRASRGRGGRAPRPDRRRHDAEPAAPGRAAGRAGGRRADATGRLTGRRLATRAWRTCSSTWPARWSTTPTRSSVESFEEDDGTIVLELEVAEEDAGKVIGRGGRTIAALRTVVKASVGQGGPARPRRRDRLRLSRR